MRRDRIRCLERRTAPPRMTCVMSIEDGQEPEGGIYCHYANAKIPYEECPGYNGQECPHCHEFVKVRFRTVRAGPNGELQVYGSPEWPFDEVSDCTGTE